MFVERKHSFQEISYAFCDYRMRELSLHLKVEHSHDMMHLNIIKDFYIVSCNEECDRSLSGKNILRVISHELV